MRAALFVPQCEGVKFRNTLLTCVIKRFPRTSCPKTVLS